MVRVKILPSNLIISWCELTDSVILRFNDWLINFIDWLNDWLIYWSWCHINSRRVSFARFHVHNSLTIRQHQSARESTRTSTWTTRWCHLAAASSSSTCTTNRTSQSGSTTPRSRSRSSYRVGRASGIKERWPRSGCRPISPFSTRSVARSRWPTTRDCWSRRFRKIRIWDCWSCWGLVTILP